MSSGNDSREISRDLLPRKLFINIAINVTNEKGAIFLSFGSYHFDQSIDSIRKIEFKGHETAGDETCVSSVHFRDSSRITLWIQAMVVVPNPNKTLHVHFARTRTSHEGAGTDHLGFFLLIEKLTFYVSSKVDTMLTQLTPLTY